MPWIETRLRRLGKRYAVFDRVDGKAKAVSLWTYHYKTVTDLLRDYDHKKAAGEISYLDPSKTVSELTDEYVSSCEKTHAKRTVEWKKYSLNKFKAYAPGVRASAVTHETIERFKAHMLSEDHTINGTIIALRAIKAFFQWAVDLGYISKNPAKRAMIKMRVEKVARFLKDDEVLKLLTACESNPELHDIVRVALHTGMRAGEILDMKAEDVRGGRVEVPFTKTRNRRFVRISPEIAPIITRIKKGKIFSGWTSGRLNRTFQRATRRAKLAGRIRKGKKLHKNAKQTAKDSEIQGRLRFHDLRHTFASKYLENGGNLAGLMEVMGHKTLAAVSVYTHFQQSYQDDKVDGVTYGKTVGQKLGRGHFQDTSRNAKKHDKKEHLPSDKDIYADIPTKNTFP